VDLPRLRAIVEAVLSSGRELLTEPEAKDFLAAAGLPVVPTRTVGIDPTEAVAAADAMGYPVVVKILSHTISHKSDVGGVRLNIGSADELREVCTAMLERVRTLRPDADVQGFTVQPMVRKKHAHELIIGASVDPIFGPVILFGAGGTAVEVLADRALALPPLNTPLALAQIQCTRIAKLLQGYRDEPAADVNGIAQVLVAVSQLLVEVPELAELDINPLLANHEGAVALDARVRLSAARPAGAAHFAIQPYPQHLVESWAWQGEAITLRPIRPEDEAQHRRFLEQLDPEDIRLRVFYSRRSIEHSELARLTQIDYAREMAFIATRPLSHDGEETLGAVRATVDPDNHTAEFGVIVRSDLKGSGLGHRLMGKMIEHLRARGTQRLVGTVLRVNTGMLELAHALGFQESRNPSDPGDHQVRFVSLELQPAASTDHRRG
jgi:acetyltransferase